MNKRSKKYLPPVIGVFWFCAALLAINWVSESKFKDFDPELRLSSQVMSLSMEAELESALAGYFSTITDSELIANYASNNKGRIIHLSQGNCFCETLSQAHQKTLNSWAEDKQISFQTLNLSAAPELLRFVPSTPAIIVLNQKNQLIYLGPYSTGMGCFDDTGLVDAKIQPYFERENSEFRALIQSEAKGCYCATAPVISTI